MGSTSQKMSWFSRISRIASTSKGVSFICVKWSSTQKRVDATQSLHKHNSETYGRLWKRSDILKITCIDTQSIYASLIFSSLSKKRGQISKEAIETCAFLSPQRRVRFCLIDQWESHTTLIFADIDLDNLKRDIDILERFLDHISVYIAWWNVLEMEHATQKDRGDSLIVDYQSLREVFVIKKWRTLKQKYVEYTVKVRFNNAYTIDV